MADYKKWIPVAGLFLVSAVLSVAQDNRYMVFFKDKTGTPFSIGQPEKFLSARAIARRQRQNIALTTADLPVTPAYVAAVRATGAKTFYQTRWMNGVLCAVSPDSLDAIRALPFVDSVVYAAPGNKLEGGRIKKIKFKKASADAGATMAQLQQLGIDEMHLQGFHGENISMAFLDGGFPGVDTNDAYKAVRDENRIKMTFNFVLNVNSVYQTCAGCNHGTEVLSTVAVNTDGFTGAAWAANYYLFVTEDNSSEYRIEEYNWLFAAEKADSAGVDIISTSLGYNEFDDSSMDYKVSDLNGKRSVIVRAAAGALARGMVVVCAAGNEGSVSWHYITTPADGVGVLACGAITPNGALASFSSVGPSADGRIKPDVVAPGSGVSIINPDGSTGINSGTSFSAPLVAGLVAGVMQAFPYLSANDVYQAVILSATFASVPGNSFGYGIPSFPAIRNYVEASDTLSVYPNPSDSGKVFIKFSYQADDVAVTFFDIFGRTVGGFVSESTGLNNVIQYDVSSLPAAVYLINVKTASRNKTVRFVKSR